MPNEISNGYLRDSDYALVVSGAEDAIGQLELLPVWGFGHSWLTDDNQTTSRRWMDLVKSRARLGTYTNKGVSGKSISSIAFNTLAGTNAWTMRTKALGVVVCSINDISLYGDTPDEMLEGYKHGWRAILSILTANAKKASNTTSFAYTSDWTSETKAGTTDLTSIGGARWTTDVVGAYADFTFTGTDVDVVCIAKTTGAGLVTFTEDGVEVGSLDLTNPVAQETPAIAHIRGLASGDHTIRATLTSGDELTIDGYLIPSTAPIPGLAVFEPPVTWEDKTFGTTVGQDLLKNSLKPALQEILEDFPTFRFVDNDDGWDIDTMRNNERHPNDAGCAHLATNALAEARKLDYLPGLHVMGIGADAYPDAYTAPAAPGIPVNGSDGTGTAGPAPLFEEDFDGADANLTTPWAAFASTSSVVFATRTNRAAYISGNNGTGQTGNASIGVDVGDTDFEMEVDISVVDALANRIGGPMFRGVDRATFWYVDTRENSTSGLYRLIKREAGTTVVDTAATEDSQAGDRLRIRCEGNNIKVYLKRTGDSDFQGYPGSPMLSGAAATPAGQICGFNIGTANTAGRFDNMVVNPLV